MLYYVLPRFVLLVAFLLVYALVWLRELKISKRDA